MPLYTVPNQRIVTIHREHPKQNFLGIQNDHWQYAARDLGAHALMLYLYFAANANNYTLALSPQDIQNTIGMPQSTYRDQFKKLITKGYLVQRGKNSYDFYELPQTRTAEQLKNSMASIAQQETVTAQQKTQFASDTAVENIEINNIQIENNEINIIEPKEKEFVF